VVVLFCLASLIFSFSWLISTIAAACSFGAGLYFLFFWKIGE
jgi:hypothetical protein